MAVYVDRAVSIHAPARGATYRFRRRQPRQYVSIHAPARGATCRFRHAHDQYRCFDPRPARGATTSGQVYQERRAVSIHAPARGATRRFADFDINRLFRSTPPRGERPKPGQTAMRFPCFDPRPRAGSDLPRPALTSSPACFDPRPRAGNDVFSMSSIWDMESFDPRPRAESDRPTPARPAI